MTTALDAERSMLLRAICEAPFDDWPRLVMADWWEENGYPERAEFFRVQIELEQPIATDTVGNTIRWRDTQQSHAVALRCRESDLLVGATLHDDHPLFEIYAGKWGEIAPGNTGALYRRGTIEAVALPLAAWQQHGEALIQAYPITEVRLTDRRPDLEPCYRIGWSWTNTPHLFQRRCSLPYEIWESVLDIRDKNVALNEADCWRWLSQGCIHLARQKTGLPTINWQSPSVTP